VHWIRRKQLCASAALREIKKESDKLIEHDQPLTSRRNDREGWQYEAGGISLTFENGFEFGNHDSTDFRPTE
jgi:hypothetical protein